MDVCEPANLSARARDAYVECVQQNCYYFSVEELLVMCAKARVNVALFKHLGNRPEYAGGSFTGVGPIVWSKLTANNFCRVRSHFERLISVEELRRLNRAVDTDRARREAEKRAADQRKSEEAQKRQEEAEKRRQEEELEAKRRAEAEEKGRQQKQRQREQRQRETRNKNSALVATSFSLASNTWKCTKVCYGRRHHERRPFDSRIRVPR